MAFQGFAYSDQEELGVKNRQLSFEVTLFGSTTLASTTGFSNAPVGVQVWTQATSATAPSTANFASLLSSATPTVIGIYVKDGKAVKLNNVTILAATIQSASMTAGVVTFKGATTTAALGTISTGVDSLGNLAFQVSCTGVDLDAAAINHKFSCVVNYDVA